MKKKTKSPFSLLVGYFNTNKFPACFVLIIWALLSFGSAVGQTTVYSNSFDNAENTLASGNLGTPAVIWSTVSTSTTGYAKTSAFSSNYLLQIRNDLSTPSVAGRTYVSGELSKYSSPFNTTLNSNTSDITWTFNIRSGRNTTSAGFGSTEYASAVVLCSTNSNFLTADGYAVTLAKGSTYNAVRLVRFAGGLSANTNVTTIIGPSPDNTTYTDYNSVKVVYSPSTNKWKLFSRNDGTSVSVDPQSGTLTQIGAETVENTLTSTAMSNFGFFYNHGSTAYYPTYFDNFKVVRSQVISWTSGWPKAETPTSNGFTAKVNTNIAGISYYVVLAKDATAPSSAQVKAGQDAAGATATASGSIACAAGNTEYTAAAGGSLLGSTPYDVYFVVQDASGNLQSPVKVSLTTAAGFSAPSIQDPTATTITNNSALLGGNITSDGGTTITERGTIWNTTGSVVITDNKLDETGRTNGIFSHSRTSLPAKSKIYYKAYASNSVNTTLSSEANFYTLADEPTAQVTAFTATASGNTSIDLSWTAAAGADGYIILQKQSASASTGDPVDGTYYTVGNAIGNGTVAAYVTSGATTTQTISGLSGGMVYTFKILSVNSDGVNAGTYNYLTTSAPTASATTSTVTYTWNQTGTASWATASNWTPTRTTPDPSDILQFTSGGSIIVTDVPTQTIAQLTVTNNTTLELRSTAASTLTIGGASGTDLTVATGSALNISQATTGIVISLATGATGSISGTMTFSGGAHTLTAVDASSISFKTGSTFTGGTGLTTNPFGKTALNSVVFESGSSFIFIGGYSPFGAAAPSSVVVFQTGSTYVHKAPGASTPSLGQRTYANFEVNEATANITAATSQPLTIDNLTVTSGSFPLGVSNALTIKGNVSVASGATLTLNPATAGTVSLKGDLNIASGGTLNVNPTVTEAITFAGTGVQTINNAGTFTSNAGTSYIVANSVGVNVASNISMPALTINTGGLLNINAGKQLNVSTTLSNSGTLNLRSTSDGTATILTPATISGTGGVVTVQQYLASSRNWYMSSPVSGAASLPTVDTGTLTIYSYPESDENQAITVDGGYAAGAHWNTVSSGTFATGTGYIVNPSAVGSTLTFTGTGLITGDQAINGLTYTAANPKHGFNLIGNPYPSYLNVLPSIIANTNLETTVWYRTRDNANYYHCETVNASTGVGTNASLTGRVTGYIPPMQGFWVKTTSNNQSITLSNANRSHTTNVDLTSRGLGSVPTTSLKSPAEKSQLYTLLGLNVSNGITGDETILMFAPEASNNLDNYDSGKISNYNMNIPELFTVSGGSQLAINSMNTIPYDSEIVLGFTTGKSGSFTINASQINNFAEKTQILLKDNYDPLNPVITDLTRNGYSFNSDITTANTSRFALIFKAPSVATGLNTNSNENSWISTNENNQIMIHGSIGTGTLAVYNAVGQKLFYKNLTSNLYVLDTPLHSGVYLVIVSTSGKSFSKKVIID